ncbi:hypothetical protein [Vulgatibacter incomptus]|uniref:Uncharacterized protein n=1 Tax=Vulgatibacter incomptus TaxID=1391653 RepID=A0A0K1PBR4_9BACT|nr:hypothetical protein [Vulgatibacter incomptus]AKU90978.1 hypothetical protein AKJ08_1365 [Vulgatibacter incomptus]
MPDVVLLRESLPAFELSARFLEAASKGADVDLIVEGRRAAMLPGIARRLFPGTKLGVAAAAVGVPLFPKVMALFLQARQLGFTWNCRKVSGAREVIVELRRERTIG